MADLSTEELAALASATEEAKQETALAWPKDAVGVHWRNYPAGSTFVGLASPDRVAALVAEVQRLRAVERTFRKMVEDGHPDSPEWFAIASNVLNNAAGGRS